MGAQQAERGGREAGLHDRALVGEVERDDVVGGVRRPASPATAVTATVRERAERISAWATSVVVPERESASTTSYVARRHLGGGERVGAPVAALSRSAA